MYYDVIVGTTNDDIGVMFLAEVALGRECHIDKDNHTLIRPPDGYDSVVARGRTEPGNNDYMQNLQRRCKFADFTTKHYFCASIYYYFCASIYYHHK